MADTPNYDNSVPFPVAGEGALLRFRTIDLIALEKQFGEEWYGVIPKGLEANSNEVMVHCLKAGLKQKDGKTPFMSIDFNDLPFAIWQAKVQIFDAITLAISGLTYAAILHARQKQQEEALEGLLDGLSNPLRGSEDSSDESSGPATESALPLSRSAA